MKTKQKKHKEMAGHVCGLHHSIVSLTVESGDQELHTILNRKHLSGELVSLMLEGRSFEFIVIEAMEWTDGTHFQFATPINLDVK